MKYKKIFEKKLSLWWTHGKSKTTPVKLKDTTIVLKGTAKRLGLDIAEWWKQIESEDNFILMVFKTVVGERRIVMDREVKEWMEEMNGEITCPPYYGFGWIQISGVNLFTMSLDDYLGWCDPSFFGGIPKPKKKKLKKVKKLKRKPKVVKKKLKLKRLKR